MNAMKLLLILASGVLGWYLPSYAEQQANRLEQEGSGGASIFHQPPIKALTVPTTLPSKPQREKDDLPPPAVINVPDPGGDFTKDTHTPAAPEDKATMRNAGYWRQASKLPKDCWWYFPAGLTALLILGKLKGATSRPDEVTEPTPPANDTDAAHKREMEKLDRLIELERLKAARQPEPAKEVGDEKPKPPA